MVAEPGSGCPMKLQIAIPAYNEESSLESIINLALAARGSHTVERARRYTNLDLMEDRLSHFRRQSAGP